MGTTKREDTTGAPACPNSEEQPLLDYCYPGKLLDETGFEVLLQERRTKGQDGEGWGFPGGDDSRGHWAIEQSWSQASGIIANTNLTEDAEKRRTMGGSLGQAHAAGEQQRKKQRVRVWGQRRG